MFHFIEQIETFLSCSSRHWKFSLEKKKIRIMLTKRLLILHSHHSAWIVQQLLGISGSSGSWDGRAGGWRGICSLQTCRRGPARSKTSQSSICCVGTSWQLFQVTNGGALPLVPTAPAWSPSRFPSCTSNSRANHNHPSSGRWCHNVDISWPLRSGAGSAAKVGSQWEPIFFW